MCAACLTCARQHAFWRVARYVTRWAPSDSTHVDCRTFRLCVRFLLFRRTQGNLR